MCAGAADYRGFQVHEIERKSHSQEPHQRANYLKTCAPCHEGPLATMPHAQQLAIKLLRDPDHYDLTAWLRIRDPQLKAPHRVTQGEIDQWKLELTNGQ